MRRRPRPRRESRPRRAKEEAAAEATAIEEAEEERARLEEKARREVEERVRREAEAMGRMVPVAQQPPSDIFAKLRELTELDGEKILAPAGGVYAVLYRGCM